MDERVARPVKHVFDGQIAFLNGQRGGNEQSSVYDGIKNILLFDFQNEYSKVIYKQILLWNPAYNLHRLIILVIIIYFIIKKQQTVFTYFLFISAASQHFVLFITFPSSRYSYLAWLLTLMLFFKIESEQKVFKRSFLFFKEKLKL